MKKLILLIFLSIILSALSAQVLLPKVITNNMVLQREKPVAIWGTAAPDEKIIVSFAGQTKVTHANVHGDWQVKLDPMKASAVPQKMTISLE